MKKREEIQRLFDMMGKDDIEELIFELIDNNKIKEEDIFFIISNIDLFGN